MKRTRTDPVYTYNALYVSVSSSLGSTCMAVQIQMNKIGGACTLHGEILVMLPSEHAHIMSTHMGFIYETIDRALLMINRAF